MIKSELVDTVANSSCMTKKTAANVINACLEAICDSLARGEKVRLAGLGSFSVVQRKARKGRNPQTGEAIVIPAKTKLRFNPAKQLRQAVV